MLAAAALTIVGMSLTRSADQAEAAVGATPRRPHATLDDTAAEKAASTFRLDSKWRLSAASWDLEDTEGDASSADGDAAVEDAGPLAKNFTGLDVAVIR